MYLLQPPVISAVCYSESSLRWPSIAGGLLLQVAFNHRFYGIYINICIYIYIVN